eukprot:EG_transcript_17075
MPVCIETRSAKDIYNLPLFNGFLVIDGRSKEDFDHRHLMTAASLPPFPLGTEIPISELEKMLLEFVIDLVNENAPEHFDPVVLYGYSDGSSDDHLKHIANLLMTVIENGPVPNPGHAALPAGEAEWTDAAVRDLRCRLAQRCSRIWVLEGGYEAFARLFPFATVQHETFLDIGAPAYCCEPYLFLGSRAFQPTAERLAAMGITHVITQHPRAHNPQSPVDVPALPVPGVSYLWCDVPDADTASMALCWAAAARFIQDASEANGRVLVQLHGRSRSASVVAAFYMAAFKMSSDQAVAKVEAVCKKFDKSLVFRDQLASWLSPPLLLPPSTGTVEKPS